MVPRAVSAAAAKETMDTEFCQLAGTHRSALALDGRHFSPVVRKMGRAVPGQRAVVLVVEDEHLVRETALEMIEEAGFEAIAASNADEAIRILESRNDIRAVFTDVEMPGSMNGLRLVRIVRTRWPPVALIVTSGRTMLAEQDLPSSGKFLRKPYGASQIKAALEQLIR
jgi:CheY-like chemotaxis protein